MRKSGQQRAALQCGAIGEREYTQVGSQQAGAHLSFIAVFGPDHVVCHTKPESQLAHLLSVLAAAGIAALTTTTQHEQLAGRA